MGAVSSRPPHLLEPACLTQATRSCSVKHEYTAGWTSTWPGCEAGGGSYKRGQENQSTGRAVAVAHAYAFSSFEIGGVRGVLRGRP